MKPARTAIFEQTIETDTSFDADGSVRAIFVCDGQAKIGDASLNAGEGCFVGEYSISPITGNCQLILFEFRRDGSDIEARGNSRLIQVSDFEWPEGAAIFRLDRVTFPKGAIAYRHVHPGAGFRYLTKGQLEINSDDHSQMMKPGQAWFEDANSPVRAVSSTTQTSQFVRAMILPIDYEGKTTIRYLNPEDEDLPKLQQYHRFFDQRVNF